MPAAAVTVVYGKHDNQPEALNNSRCLYLVSALTISSFGVQSMNMKSPRFFIYQRSVQIFLCTTFCMFMPGVVHAQFCFSEIQNSPFLLTNGKEINAIDNGDFDNDGRHDIVVSYSASSIISVFRNNAAGYGPAESAFDPPADFPYGTGASAQLVAGDLNNDRLADVVIANSATPSVYVMRNTTTGSVISFGETIQITLPFLAKAVAICDMNMDGKNDIITACGNSIGIFLNSTVSGGSKFNFGEPVYLNAGCPVHDIKCADFDGDGNVDIIAGCSDKVNVFKNSNSTGTMQVSFEPAYDFPAVHSVFAMEIGDMDGDFKPDIITANWPENDFSVFRNNSSAGKVLIDTMILFSTMSPAGIAIGDFDQDGRFDVATMIAGDGNNLAEFYRNTSRGEGKFSFSAAQRYNPVSDKMVVDDFDGDGVDDFASVSHSQNAVAVWVHDASPKLAVLSGFETFCGEDGMAWLTWKSKKETGVSRFIIEKTTDGIIFTEAGRINAKGTSELTSEYSFSDQYPVDEVGYYRVRTEGNNGQTEYSSLIALNPCEPVVTDFICVFPNPVENIMNFHFSIRSQIGMHFEIVNMQMQKQLEKSETVTPGSRTYSLDVSDLQKGTYLLSVSFGNLPPKVCRFEKL